MISVRDLSIGFGGNPLFENANFKIERDDKIALVGSNGAGKTTLLRIIAGEEEPDEGEIQKQKGISVGYLPQEFLELKGGTVFDEVKSALKLHNELEAAENIIQERLSSEKISRSEKEKLLRELGEIQHRKEISDYYSAEAKIKRTLTGLGFAEKDFYRSIDEFSGGWKMRVHLAKILVAENDLIMLDEPTNHLDLFSLRWLISFLENFKGALLIVSHDRYFIERITNKTFEISNRKINAFPGKFPDYLKFKKEREEQLLSLKKNQEKKIRETQKFIERFRYKATKAKQVQSRIKFLEKLEKIEIENAEREIKIKFNEPPRLPAIPLEVKNVYKSYGELKVLEDVSFTLERGDKMAFVGVNGAGKSTLAKIISGKLFPDKGKVIVHEMTKVGYYSQEVADNLDMNADALDTLMREEHDYTLAQIRSILGAFLFSDDDAFKKVSVLSGGEKSRLALARLLLQKTNLLVLDEPTNHLDYASKEVLQKALIDFQGSVILISHDVDFMKPFINKVLLFENKRVKLFHGGIEYFLKKFSFENAISKPAHENKNELSRKELKRREAELRQKKFRATKNLKERIEKLENEIETLEEKIAFLQNEMTKEEVYSNPQKMKEVQTNFKNSKETLNAALTEWTELSEQLEKIEKEFDV